MQEEAKSRVLRAKIRQSPKDSKIKGGTLIMEPGRKEKRLPERGEIDRIKSYFLRELE